MQERKTWRCALPSWSEPQAEQLRSRARDPELTKHAALRVVDGTLEAFFVFAMPKRAALVCGQVLSASWQPAIFKTDWPTFIAPAPNVQALELFNWSRQGKRPIELAHEDGTEEAVAPYVLDVLESKWTTLADVLPSLRVVPSLPDETPAEQRARLRLDELDVLDPREWVLKARLEAMQPKPRWPVGVDELHKCHVLYELERPQWQPLTAPPRMPKNDGRGMYVRKLEPEVERLTGSGKAALVQFLLQLYCMVEGVHEFRGVQLVPAHCKAPAADWLRMYARELKGQTTLSYKPGRVDSSCPAYTREASELLHIKTLLARAVLNQGNTYAVRFLCLCLGAPEWHRRSVAFCGRVSDAGACSTSDGGVTHFYAVTTPFAFSLSGEPVLFDPSAPWLQPGPLSYGILEASGLPSNCDLFHVQLRSGVKFENCSSDRHEGCRQLMLRWFDSWWAYCDFRAGCVDAARRSLEAVEAACSRAKSVGLMPCRYDNREEQRKMLRTDNWTWWRQLTFSVDGAMCRYDTDLQCEYSGCDERLERARKSLELAQAKLSVLQQHVDGCLHGRSTPAAWVKAGCGDGCTARPTTYRHELAVSREPRIRPWRRDELQPSFSNGTGCPVYDRPPSFVDATFNSQQGERGHPLPSYSASPSCTDVGEVSRVTNGAVEVRPAVDMLETLLTWAEHKAAANGVALPYLAGTRLGLPALQGGGFSDSCV